MGVVYGTFSHLQKGGGRGVKKESHKFSNPCHPHPTPPPSRGGESQGFRTETNRVNRMGVIFAIEAMKNKVAKKIFTK